MSTDAAVLQTVLNGWTLDEREPYLLRRGNYTLHVLEHKNRTEVLGGAKTGTSRLHRAWIEVNDDDEDIRRKIEDDLLPDLYADADERTYSDAADQIDHIRSEHAARVALAAELAPLFDTVASGPTACSQNLDGPWRTIDVATPDSVNLHLSGVTADQARKIAAIVRPQDEHVVVLPHDVIDSIQGSLPAS